MHESVRIQFFETIFQGEPGIGVRGERGATGQKGDKGDRGHLGLPVSTEVFMSLHKSQ